MSERDGWNHLYLYDAKTGQVKNQITKGPWVVRGVERVDEAKRQVWFRAGGIRPGQDPYYIHYCRVNFDGSGLTVLTEGDGTHTIDFSPDGRYLIDTYSRVDHAAGDRAPPQRRRQAGLRTRAGRLERACCKPAGRSPERFVAKGRDGTTDIYGVIFRPTNFDPAKKYPVIEDIYAGPQDSFVPKRFAAFHPPSGDGRTGIHRRADRRHGHVEPLEEVPRRLLEEPGRRRLSRPHPLDPRGGRQVSVTSTSTASASTAARPAGRTRPAAVMTHGDFYKAAVADCGCHDNRMDKIWWNEQWMGWPVGPQYAANSNVTLAPGLKGKLLLIVGEMDTNVDPASTMQVVNALIRADKDFELLVVPGSDHGAAESPYGRRRRADFFVRNLLGVEPRQDREYVSACHHDQDRRWPRDHMAVAALPPKRSTCAAPACRAMAPGRPLPGRETAVIRGPGAARRWDRQRPTPHSLARRSDARL